MATVGQSQRAIDMTAHQVHARDVQAGDWTKYSGWHRVVEVKRLSRKRVGLVREGGRMRSEDKLEGYQLVTVYRETTEET